MRFSENRTIAFIVLAVCVVVSLFGLGGMGLARERGKVLTVFDAGTDASMDIRHSMDAYLDSASERALVMAGEYEIYLGESQLTKDVTSEAEALADDASGVDARYAAYGKLKGHVEQMYNKLYGEVDSSQFRNFKLAYDDFKGFTDMIERDDYHKLAKAYNSTISGFPGGLVAGVMGQGALNTFGG